MTNGKVLLVEDNPDEVALMIRALKKAHITNEVVVKHDGVEAIEYLLPKDAGADTELPVLVLLDLNLPRMTGRDVLRKMRSEHRTRLVPVVVLSCSNHKSDIVESYLAGANSYIYKPIDFDEFLQTVNVLSHYWLDWNQSPGSE